MVGFRTVCLVLFWLCLLLSRLQAAPAAPMLPQVDSGERDVSGWLMSEKLDGVRGYWDGRQLWSKNGHLLHPPPAFVAGFPPFPLEGELWGGRGTFESTAAAVLRERPHDGWLALQYAVFDVPAAPGGFAQRIEFARQWFASRASPYAFVIPQVPIRDRGQLDLELRRIEALGGEGLIVRAPDAPYLAGRRPEVLKVKSFHDDEAVVLAHLPGQGRLNGMLGALLVALPDGTEFRLGTGFSDAQRRNPPPVGTLITFRHHGRYASGLPRFPSFLRVRSDQGF